MKYKTMTLELLQDRPQLYDQLIRSRTLLATLERYAQELRDSHHNWMEQLWRSKPNSDANQIASQALELALEELVSRLDCGFPANENEPLSLDAAMAFIRPHTPTA